ncbi:LacI family transcriptional regulator [Spirillospora sp. NBC_00431]
MTINDVAAESGVSRATVSLVLRGSPRISEATRQRVHETMARLGYIYNRHAANLRSSRTMTLGLVLTGIRDPWSAEVTMAVEERAHDAGCTLLTGYSRDSLSRQEKLLATMLEQRVDGLVLLPTSDTSAADLAATLGASGTPHVMLDRRVAGHAADFAGVDNRTAALEIGAHLAELGARSVGFLGGLAACPVRADREEGLRESAARHKIDIDDAWSIRTGADRVAGADATDQILERHAPPDAIVGFCDVVALGAMAALRRHGIEPGLGVAVAGFDDIDDASLQRAPLTTAATYPENLGMHAVTMLLERIDDPGLEHREAILRPELRVRDSTTEWARRGARTPRRPR